MVETPIFSAPPSSAGAPVAATLPADPQRQRLLTNLDDVREQVRHTERDGGAAFTDEIKAILAGDRQPEAR